jgi:hypothetical protein
MIKSKSNILHLTHEPYDSKIANIVISGSDISIESISDYLDRVKLGIRVPGVIVAIVINPGNTSTVTVPIASLDSTLRDYTNKYYAFIGGIRDEDFKEIIITGGGEDGKSAYELAVDNGFSGTEEEWVESLVGLPGNDGIGISSINLISIDGLIKTYRITFTNSSTTTFEVSDGDKGGTGDKGDKGDNAVHIEPVSIRNLQTHEVVYTFPTPFPEGTTPIGIGSLSVYRYIDDEFGGTTERLKEDVLHKFPLNPTPHLQLLVNINLEEPLEGIIIEGIFI